MEGVEVETPVGVESVPVTVTVNKDDDHGGVGRRQGNEDVESAVLRKRRDSEGLREDMEKFAPSPRDLGGRFFCLAGGDNSLGAKLVRCDREYYPEGDWTAEDNRYYGIAIFIFLVWAAINVWQDKDSFAYNSDVNYIFWLRMFVTLSFNLLISSVVGYFVVHRDWHIGYSRKLLHFCLFASPGVVNSTLGAMDTKILGLSWLSLACQAYFVLMLKPVRRRLPVPLLLMFRALDRPQDRPYTIPWLYLQSVVGFIAMILLQTYLESRQISEAFFVIPLVVNGLGDGLAEPVGIKWGKHKYQTRAIWYHGKVCSGEFVRSLEGSACVFLSAMLSVFAVYSEWGNTTRFVIALAIVPITMTAAEAFSPHTCDTPFIFLVATALICFLFEAVDDDFDPFSPSFSQ